MMRPRLLSLAAMLATSMAFAFAGAARERERATDDRGVLTAIARRRQNAQLAKSLRRGSGRPASRQKTLPRSIAPNAMAKMRAAWAMQSISGAGGAERHARRARLVPEQRQFSSRHAVVVAPARATPLANRHVPQIPSLTFRFADTRVYQRGAPSSRARDSCYNIAGVGLRRR